MAMANADADADLLLAYTRCVTKKKVNPNESPSVRMRRLEEKEKIQCLLKTVETGRRYFPHCSKMLDNLLDNTPDELYLQDGNPEERERKRIRFMEIKEEYEKAFDKDILEQLERSGLSPFSTSRKNKMRNKVRKR